MRARLKLLESIYHVHFLTHVEFILEQVGKHLEVVPSHLINMVCFDTVLFKNLSDHVLKGIQPTSFILADVGDDVFDGKL